MIKCHTYNAYPLTNYRIYRFGRFFKKDIDIKRKLRRLKFRYYSTGITISKEYVLLTLYNSYHHIILIKLDFDKYSMLNDVVLGNCQNIKNALSDLLHSKKIRLFTKKNLKQNSRVIGIFWRSGFEKKFYPYKLPHINYYKEKKTIHLTFLNEKIIFAFPRNMSIVAVPLVEIYKNSRYGNLIPLIPCFLTTYLIYIRNKRKKLLKSSF